MLLPGFGGVWALRIELLTKGTVSVPSSDSGRARNAQQVQTAANLI
jgi:hypothetical protein